MKGKSLVFIAVLMLSCLDSLSQELTNETKIVGVYGQDWVDARKIDQPDLLILMDKYISHGFLIENVSEGKYQEIEPMEFIPLTSKTEQVVTVEEFLTDFASTTFNPLHYKFFPTQDVQIIKLKGVNKIIYILPQSSILLK
jgi:hypothetical protein